MVRGSRESHSSSPPVNRKTISHARSDWFDHLCDLSAVFVCRPASGPAFWTVATAADFLKGSSDGVSISADGVLTGGPQLTNRRPALPRRCGAWLRRRWRDLGWDRRRWTAAADLAGPA
jgi:hypothetical protein